MAQKRMYRILDLGTGHIHVADYVYDGYISLNEIVIDYDDQITPAHAKMVADAIDKRVQKLNADIVVMQHKKQDFLAIAYTQQPEQPSQSDTWEEVDE